MAKTKRKRRKGKWIFPIIVMGIAVSITYTLYDQHRELRLLQQKEMAYLEQIRKVQGEIEGMKAQIENSYNDEYIEKIAREQLKMVRKDEIIFIDLGRASR